MNLLETLLTEQEIIQYKTPSIIKLISFTNPNLAMPVYPLHRTYYRQAFRVHKIIIEQIYINKCALSSRQKSYCKIVTFIFSNFPSSIPVVNPAVWTSNVLPLHQFRTISGLRDYRYVENITYISGRVNSGIIDMWRISPVFQVG